MDTTHLIPSARTLPLVDAALALWVAAWIAFGIAIGVEVGNLTALSHTVVAEGRAVQTVGHALRPLAGMPFVGGEVSSAAQQVQGTGASAVASGQSSASSIEVLSVLLAIAVALLPSVPVFGFYLPLRVRHVREARALLRTLHEHSGDPGLEEFLARRAVESLGYSSLREISPSPWSELGDGSRAALVAAEVRRLGLDPALLRTPTSRRA
ncbi:MAG: hypothetical protein ACRDK2_12235 [Solirubrobacteraceae bacterium]